MNKRVVTTIILVLLSAVGGLAVGFKAGEHYALTHIKDYMKSYIDMVK